MYYEFTFSPFEIEQLCLSVEACDGSRAGFRREGNTASIGIAHGGHEVRVTARVSEEIPDFLAIAWLIQRVREVLRVLGVDLPVVQWREVTQNEHR